MGLCRAAVWLGRQALRPSDRQADDRVAHGGGPAASGSGAGGGGWPIAGRVLSAVGAVLGMAVPGAAQPQPVPSIIPIIEVQQIPTPGGVAAVANLVIVADGVTAIGLDGVPANPFGTVFEALPGAFAGSSFVQRASVAELIAELAGTELSLTFETGGGAAGFGVVLGGAFAAITEADFPGAAEDLFPATDSVAPAPAGLTAASWTPPPLDGVDLIQAAFVVVGEDLSSTASTIGGNFAGSPLAPLDPPGVRAISLDADRLPLDPFPAGFGSFSVSYFAIGPVLPLERADVPVQPAVEFGLGGLVVVLSVETRTDFLSAGGGGSASGPADLNADGEVNVFDLLAYIGLFVAGEAAADLNDSGTVDVFDLLMYIGLFVGAG